MAHLARRNCIVSLEECLMLPQLQVDPLTLPVSECAGSTFQPAGIVR